jgi:hypothetical protein
METERDGHIAFLEINVYRRPDSSLGHRVYGKPTHTNLYLSATSHLHPVNKQAVLFTLVHRAKAICDSNSLPQELKFLHKTFRDNGYSEWQILHALSPPKRAPPQRREDPASVAFLPFVGTVFNRISRVLSKHNIKTVGLPPRKLSSFL